MDGHVKYWMDLAEYDFETAKAMLSTRRYMYVGFMCHQTVEKAIKALLSSQGKIPPKVHNLMRLASMAKLIGHMPEEMKDFLYILNPLNIEVRYPSYKNPLTKSLDETTCKEIIRETEECLCWIKKRL